MTSSTCAVVPTAGICRRCGRRKKTSTIGSNYFRYDTFSSKCIARGASGGDGDVTSKERRDRAAPDGSTRRGVPLAVVADVRKRSSTDGDSDERHLPDDVNMSTKFLWCERCNSRLVELKWRAVRVWLPLARQRLRGPLMVVEQLQEITGLLEVCIHDVLHLPLVTSDHVVDDMTVCPLCFTTMETLRMEAKQMIRSLEDTLGRSSHLGVIIAHPLNGRPMSASEHEHQTDVVSGSTPFVSDHSDFTMGHSAVAGRDQRRTVGTQCSVDGVREIQPARALITSGRSPSSGVCDTTLNNFDGRGLNHHRSVGHRVDDISAVERFDMLCQEAIDAAQNAMTLLTWKKCDSARAVVTADVPDSNRYTKEMKSRKEPENIVDNRFVGLT